MSDEGTVGAGPRSSTAPAGTGPVFVTGASRGIGRAVAELYGARGRPVGLLARSRGELEAVLAATAGPGAVAVADVGDAEALAAAMDELVAALGPPEVLVCSAGVGAYGPARSTPIAVVEGILRTNFLGCVHSVQAVVDGMMARGRGHLVFVASVAGHIGVPLEAAYSASKFAVVGWAEALAVELAGHGVRVTVVSPGPVDTAFFDTRGAPYARARPRPLPAAEVAEAIARAVERPRAEVVLPHRLRGAIVIRSALPTLFRWGVARSMRRQLREAQA
jgi:short-subunit dehydrogenase